MGQPSALSGDLKASLYPTNAIVSRYHNDWTQKHYPQRIKEFMNAPLEFGDIVFIGNSITEKGKEWSEKYGVKNIRNRGISGDVTDGVLKHLNEIVYFKPRAVFILISINDLFSLHHEEGGGKLEYDKVVSSPRYVGKNILKITKQIHQKSPQTKIYVRTILPTRRSFLKEDILLVNKMIRENAKKGYYTVVDLYAPFVDADGELTKELTVDGVHLSEKGYDEWGKFEKPIIEELIVPE